MDAPVDVSTDASAAGSDLTVLAPKAVVCLSVSKTLVKSAIWPKSDGSLLDASYHQG